MHWRPSAVAQGRPGSDGRRAARWTGLAVIAATLTVVGAFALLPLGLQIGVAALTLVLDASVWLAVSLGRGDDWWTIASTAAEAVFDRVFSSEAAALVATLVVVAAAALYGLEQLLGSDEESVR